MKKEKMVTRYIVLLEDNGGIFLSGNDMYPRLYEHGEMEQDFGFPVVAKIKVMIPERLCNRKRSNI